MGLYHTRPRFLKLAEIHDANVELNTDAVPLVQQILKIFIAIRKAHLPAFCNSEAFTRRKDYFFRSYSLMPGAARDTFQQHFDFHAAAQEEHYLVNHEIAKTHGKGKCKHARFIVNFGNLIHARLNVDNHVDWATSFDERAVSCAYALGQYFDVVTMETHDFFANLHKPSEPTEPRVPIVAPQSARRVTIASYMEHSLENVRSLDMLVLNIIWKICNSILTMQSIFFLQLRTRRIYRMFQWLNMNIMFTVLWFS